MRTGLGDCEEQAEHRLAVMYDLFLPVVEAAVVLAAEYATACGRGCFVKEDLAYSLKFAARNVLGRLTGPLFPEMYDEEEEEEENESEAADFQGVLSRVSQQAEEPWSRYEGADERLRMVNAAAETWDDWRPETPAERLIKRCVDQAA